MEPQVFQTFCRMMYNVLHIFFLLFFIYLSVNIAYLFIVSLVGFFTNKRSALPDSQKKKIAVLITSYKEDEVIVNTIKSSTEHNY